MIPNTPHFCRQTLNIRTLMKSMLLALTVILTLGGCSSKPEPLKLIANAWIGYSPLFYAKEMGWLDDHNIHLSTVVSLGESMHIYESARMDAFTGTQYEFNQLQQKDPFLTPVIMFNRSNGGDMVMSSHSLETLKAATQPIDVYLEINSVNYLVFRDFIQFYQLQNQPFNFINHDQLKIQAILQNQTQRPPSLVVTYVPYNHQLEKLGFKTLSSTADHSALLVVDALYTSESTLNRQMEQFKALKQLVDRAIADLHKDPRSYYEKVSPYLENNSFEEFQTGLESIEWLNQDLSDKLLHRLQQAQFPARRLL
jgi:NitT/TauT family transport system substrate-binding protein